MPLLMFFLMTTRDVAMTLELFYVLMLVLIIIKAFIYQTNNPGERVFRVDEYRISALPYQASLGLLVGLAATSALIAFGTFRGLADPVGTFVTQAVFVAFTETILMVVLVQTVWFRVPVRAWRRGGRLLPRLVWGEVRAGVVLWPLVFGFLHPPVRHAWLAGEFTLASLAAFAYGVAWAIVFYALYWAREVPGRHRPFFGAMTAWVAHLTANLVILSYPTRVGDFAFFPMSVASSEAWWTLLAAVWGVVVARLILQGCRKWTRP